MKKINKNKLKKLALVYLVLLLPIGIFVFLNKTDSIISFIRINLIWIIIVIALTFIINYLILINMTPSRNLDNIADIIIAEVFNESQLELKYDGELKSMLKKLEKEKEFSTISLEQYRNAEKIRAEFTSNITHELKTPLTSIMGYAELIEIGIAKDDEAKRFAKIIGDDSKELLSLIDDVITLSKYDEFSNMKLTLEKFDIGEYVSDIVEKFRGLAKLKGIIIIDNIESCIVLADKGKIADLVNNLISNGIKYNKENGQIKVTLFKRNEECILEVSDTGIGISSSGLSRIFERFYVEDTSRGKSAGTGLGLSIVKHVAKAHNGSINVESEKGKGSKFIFTFPIEQKEE